MQDRQETFFKILDRSREGIYFVDKTRTIQFWNRAAEEITGFTADEVVGSRCMDNILNHVDEEGNPLCLGLCLLAQTLKDGEEREQRIYLQHKEGHRLCVDARVVPLFDEGGDVKGAVEYFMESAVETAKARKRRSPLVCAVQDPLTRLWNRTYGESMLKARLDELARFDKGCGLLLIDIDGLEGVDDLHGPGTGDQVLRMAATTLLSSLRPFDFLCRWSDAHFMAIVVDAGEDELRRVAERSRVLVENSSLHRFSDPIRVTLSIGGGVAVEGDTVFALLKRAAALVKRSRLEGGNRVQIERLVPMARAHDGKA